MTTPIRVMIADDHTMFRETAESALEKTDQKGNLPGGNMSEPKPAVDVTAPAVRGSQEVLLVLVPSPLKPAEEQSERKPD